MPGEKTVLYTEGNELQAVANLKDSMLEAFFELNKTFQSEEGPRLYCDIPISHTFNKRTGEWKLRKRSHPVIARIYTVSPRQQEKFALRLLLMHKPGPKSFEDLRTINGLVYETFAVAAKVYGLIIDDTIWNSTLEELCRVAMPRRIRFAFALILVFNNPPDAAQLYQKYQDYIVMDYIRRHISPEQARYLCLKNIQRILQRNGRDLNHFNLDLPLLEIGEWADGEDDDVNQQCESLPPLNDDQKLIFNIIMSAVNNSMENECNAHFVHGPGGTGKTTLYKHLIHDLKIQGKATVCSYRNSCTTVTKWIYRPQYIRYKIEN